MTTQQEARDMRDALKLLEESETRQRFDARQILINDALIWWNMNKPPMPTTRQAALDAFNFIKQLLETETDRFRLALLREKLDQANNKFKEIKRIG